MRFFATAARGAESVLADELGELGSGSVTVGRGGVDFEGDLEAGYRACLWSRVASRVLLPLASFEAETAEALYAGVHAIDWTEHVGPERTLAVDVAGRDAPAGPPHFVALKTKDAIVDRVREKEGARPDVDKENPDLRVNVHVSGTRVDVAVDLGGRGLHRRGIGRDAAIAPLKENLAAAILRLAAWHTRCADTPLYDPFCGSGTLLVEAAWMALDVAPGLERGRIAAQGWRGHDAGLWKHLQAEARERRGVGLGRALEIAGSDASRSAVQAARGNLKRVGLGDRVRVARLDIRDAEPPFPRPGLLVCNPPYGERLGEAGELGPLYESLGDVLKQRFPGWTAFVLSGNPALAKRIGLRPARRHVLFNGPIECRLLEIPIASQRASGDGPGWRRPSPESESFARKLRANLRALAPWARRRGLECYRLYDADIPTFNLAVDRYGGAARVEEYERPEKVDAATAERRLREALTIVADTLEVDPKDVVLRVRRRRAEGEQATRRADLGRLREVREGDSRFLVNLTDYLDTGLFLDDRDLRARIRSGSEDRSFLNLFAYTCTATVAAAAGGAASTTSVDLSRTYLDWGRRNLALNGLASDDHRLVRADVLAWLDRPPNGPAYDLIFVAPPTWSRSKAMRGDFDVQRDHIALLERVARLLAPGGEILFATNLRRFALDAGALRGLVVREITAEVTPRDFARRPRLRAWSLRRR